MRVKDQAVNEKSDMATVVINVIGDNNSPYFIQAPYQANVNFNAKVDTLIFDRVQADDPDRGVSTFLINLFFWEKMKKNNETF